MKWFPKSIVLSVIFMLFAVCMAAAADPLPIQFRKSGGGQYIYCNNPENINAWNLSTDENPYASYMMKNEKLGPDRYSVFFCFYNCTEFNVEPDMELFSENATVTIHSVGYYLPQGKEYFDCLGAWSDFLGINIRTLNGCRQYVPYQPLAEQFPKTIALNGESDWISRYLYNYDVVKPRTTFLMLVDFSIEEGEADINFAALKHYGAVGDRTHHNPDAAPGNYHRDTSVKGIDTETLPMVECDLNVVIDAQMQDGDPVMVELFNPFHPEGNVAPYWMTNINPARDAYLFSKNVAAGSDMLELRYRDDTKLRFYGKNVPDALKDNVWRFDLFHHDTKEYQSGMPWAEEDYIPNAEHENSLDLEHLPNTEWEANIGNFGVTNRYHLTVRNEDGRERVLNYMLDTVFASNIVMVRDEAGNLLNPYTLTTENAYALSKGITYVKKEDCMLSIPLLPGQSKQYIVDVIEPTNCYGGILQSLKVDRYSYRTEESRTVFPQYTQRYPLEYVFYNGQEFMRWIAGELYHYTAGQKWEKLSSESGSANFLKGLDENNQLVKLGQGEGYAARFSAWDEYEKEYIPRRKERGQIFLYDESLEYTGERQFPEYVERLSYVSPTLYALTDQGYCTSKAQDFLFSPLQTEILWSNGKAVVSERADGIFFSRSSSQMTKVSFEGTQPKNIALAGDLFYFLKSWKAFYDDPAQNILSVSADGIHWTNYLLPDQFYELKRVFHFDGKIYVDCKYEQFAFEDNDIVFDAVLVKQNDEILAFQTPAELQNDRTMVPMRYFFEKLGAQVTWVEQERKVIVEQEGQTVCFSIGSDIAYVNQEPRQLDAPPYLSNDKTLIPIRFLSEALGYDVAWSEETKTVSVTGG